MKVNVFLLLILFGAVFLKNIFFWGKIIQMKDYRFDRLKEFFGSPEGIRSIFNIYNGFYFLFIFFFAVFTYFLITFKTKIFGLYSPSPEILGVISFSIYYALILLYLTFEFVLVARKFYKKNLVTPKFTKRFILISFVGILLQISSLIIGYKIGLENIFSLVFFILIFTPIFLFLGNILTLPITKYLRNKVIINAQNKIKKFDNLKKIGITGSYGKSSVKQFLYQILKVKYKVLATPENKNNEMGVSETILESLNENYEYFISEMGAYRIGEIALLGEIVDHKDAFLTGINTQHISLFGSQENIIKGKSEIMRKVLKNGGKLYINFDNDFCKNLDFPEGLKIVSYALTNIDAKALSQIIEIDNGKTIFDFRYGTHEFIFETNIIGTHNILNLTGVIAYALDQGIPITDIAQVISSLEMPKATMNVIKLKNGIILIDDTYNLNETGLIKGTETLSFFKNKNKILVLDDIIELGLETENIHKKIGENLANIGLDYIFLVGKNYKKLVIEGLKKSNFDMNKLIGGYEELEDLSKKDVVILFEGRGTRNFLENFKRKIL
ncbi:MAG: UDP-N-acetylmuramoyl-tripeptide--D-alanyl-D-alanine ligase [Candidatus Gracilibacteria bacterium]|nr:UDP-N-acetylmuramoyl-tripeptide--D-alanyl-D-alanine ligase [Candidatus Gracilibacteria bacterium]MDD4530765.1 UDP-N-acetylmuramoyl-tripeptide--D-alanyl-D-alanine ligase [Candidatus Gracilibacteria bacterium]